jgi:hypothetical protein
MKKFDSYPIYINFTKKVEGLPELLSMNFETVPDLPSSESRQYEDEIGRLLTLICSTRIGKFVLDSLNPGKKYWVVPFELSPFQNAQAATWLASRDEGGGVRVYFTPANNRGDVASGDLRFSDDDVLFHEFVHAYRFGQDGWEKRVDKSMNKDEYTDAEEFVALQLQNVYLSQRRSNRFYLNYRSQRRASKSWAYQAIANDPEVLRALRFWVQRDPLVAGVASWGVLAAPFNAFRDGPSLERIYHLQHDFPNRQLPNFLTDEDRKRFERREKEWLRKRLNLEY